MFKLVLKAAANDQRAVQSMLYTIRLPQLNAEQILSSEPYPFLQLHPEDKLPDLKIDVSFAQLEDLMLTSLERIAAGAGESAAEGGSSAAGNTAAAAGRERP